MTSERFFPIADDATVYDATFLERLRGARPPAAEGGEAADGDELGAELVEGDELLGDGGEGPGGDGGDGPDDGPATEREPARGPGASISPESRIDPGAEVGPFVVVGPGVEVGPGCRLAASCVLEGPLVLGANNRVYSFAVLGAPPQDRSYAGEPTRLVVGEGNEFREHVTVHRGTAKDRALTRVGSGGLFMAGSHVAHDCQVGDHVTLANGTLLGGHVVLEDHVVAGGRVAVAPKVRVGAGAFLAAGAMVERDVPPFVIAAGDRARVRAVNRVGLARMGAPASSVAALERAFRHLYHSGRPRLEALRSLDRSLAADPYVARLVAFWAGRRLRWRGAACAPRRRLVASSGGRRRADAHGRRQTHAPRERRRAPGRPPRRRALRARAPPRPGRHGRVLVRARRANGRGAGAQVRARQGRRDAEPPAARPPVARGEGGAAGAAPARRGPARRGRRRGLRLRSRDGVPRGRGAVRSRPGCRRRSTTCWRTCSRATGAPGPRWPTSPAPSRRSPSASRRRCPRPGPRRASRRPAAPRWRRSAWRPRWATTARRGRRRPRRLRGRGRSARRAVSSRPRWPSAPSGASRATGPSCAGSWRRRPGRRPCARSPCSRPPKSCRRTRGRRGRWRGRSRCAGRRRPRGASCRPRSPRASTRRARSRRGADAGGGRAVAEALGVDALVVVRAAPRCAAPAALAQIELYAAAGGFRPGAPATIGADVEAPELLGGARTVRDRFGLRDEGAGDGSLAALGLPAAPRALARALLAQRALRRGDLDAARRELGAEAAGPGEAPALRLARAQLTSAEGRDREAQGLAAAALGAAEGLRREDRLALEAEAHRILFDFGRAVDAQRALWATQPELLEHGFRLAELLTAAGRLAEAKKVLAHVSARRPADDDGSVGLLLGAALYRSGARERAVEGLGPALERAERAGNRSAAAQGGLLLSNFFRGRDLTAAKECAERARRLYESVGDGTGVVRAELGLAWTAFRAERSDEVGAAIARARRRAPGRRGDRRGADRGPRGRPRQAPRRPQARPKVGRSGPRRRAHHGQQAPRLERAERLGRPRPRPRRPRPRHAALPRSGRARQRHRRQGRGRHRAAEHGARAPARRRTLPRPRGRPRVGHAYREVRDRYDVARALDTLGLVEIASGRPADARKLFEEALAVREGNGLVGGQSRQNLAEALRNEGRLAEAIATCRRAVDELRERQLAAQEVNALMLLADMLVDAGDVPRARGPPPTAPSRSATRRRGARRRAISPRRSRSSSSPRAIAPRPSGSPARCRATAWSKSSGRGGGSRSGSSGCRPASGRAGARC